MNVERALLREIRLRLREPFRTSRGTVEERRIVLVTLYGGGLEGWGECVAGVDASSAETVASAWDALETLILPIVVGRELAGPPDALEVAAGVERHPMAFSAAEMATWDLAARAKGASLSQQLGGVRRTIPVGVSVGLQPSDRQLCDVVARYLAEGYARVKVKIEPGRDVEMMATLRERFPTASLWADANASYTQADALRLRELDTLDLGLLEQPLAPQDLEGHARLRETLATPICLDESIASEADARRALEIGACGVVNLKPGRVGGHAASLRIHDLVRAAGLDLWCGGMLESGIGRAHNLALASLPGFTLPGDISASQRYWSRDVVSPELDIENSRMAVPSGPGIGIDIDMDFVEALTVRKAFVP